jgi:hypothetical protein
MNLSHLTDDQLLQDTDKQSVSAIPKIKREEESRRCDSCVNFRKSKYM